MTSTVSSQHVPLFMQQRSTDEYDPQPYSAADRRVVARIRQKFADTEDKTVGSSPAALAASRLGTAIGLRAINDEWGTEFYEVPETAAMDAASANAFFARGETVIDVQTHLLAPHAAAKSLHYDSYYSRVMPDWWKELRPGVSRDLAWYLEAVFLKCDNAVAVLTSGPGTDPAVRALFNDELYAVRSLVDGLAGTGRLYNHAVVHAQEKREVDGMEEFRDEFDPIGWKVYTPGKSILGQDGGGGSRQRWVDGWMLDDEEHGFPFLERARDLNVRLVCAHKGLSGMADNGTARDIGPAARAFPELNFVVYHSGFEVPTSLGTGEEGPYSPAAQSGVNTLIRSVEEAGVAAQGNVFAELGTTWFCLIRRPREAAHVWGKLLKALGEDNVVWGSDSIWYGSPQPTIDAFRAFQIPDDMCEEFGYPKITPEMKAKILGKNASRIYGIDLDRAAENARSDDLAWARRAIADYEEHGFDGLR